MGYLTFKARSTFTQLRKAFTKAPILGHFYLKYHIWIETDLLGYVISGVLSQLTSDNFDQWNLITFYSQKMILAKIWYETHDVKLLPIVNVFKTWRQYLEGCKHKVLVLTNHNNLRRFMDTKN